MQPECLDGINMADIRNQPSDYVRFTLKSEIASPRRLLYDPVGWADDDVEYVRHENYHGIMTSFTGDLVFYKEDRDYILEDWNTLGINSNLVLQKEELVEVGGETRWETTYSGTVDYSTKTESDLSLSVKFNSNLLESIIDTRENDEFDLERLFSIDEEAIPSLKTNTIDIDGIPISESTVLTLVKSDTIDDGVINNGNDYESDYARGEGDHQHIVFQGGLTVDFNDGDPIPLFGMTTPILELSLDGNNRISSPGSTLYNADEASQMFYVDSVDVDPDSDLNTELSFSYSVDAYLKTIRWKGTYSRHSLNIALVLVRYARNADTLEYETIERVTLQEIIAEPGGYKRINVAGEYTASNLKDNEGLAMGFLGIRREYAWSSIPIRFDAKVYEFNLSLNLKTSQPKTTGHKFLFVEDALNRLAQIMTGDDDRLVTRDFCSPENSKWLEGKYGSIGLTYGLWIRKFTEDLELYKSMVISFSDLIDSLKAVFNIGLGIELIDGKQRIVVEDLRFFYQNKVLLRLPIQIDGVKRVTVAEDIFSSIQIGYDKGGNYSDTLGLDEPNIETNRITHVKKNKSEYKKMSSIRADDIGLELIRRKPASIDPKEDTAQDEHIWFLDVKKGGDDYIQKSWADRLKFKPEGLSYADHFRSFFFTPLTNMFRHGWVLRTGLNQKINLSKRISHINSSGNSALKMQFIEQTSSHTEDENVLVSYLDRPLTEPETVEFTYPISKELLRELTGRSQIDYNGNTITIPNYYFKIEYLNEENEMERGYILSIKPSENKIKVIKSNEKTI